MGALKDYVIYERLKVTSTVNGFLYGLQKLPVIGKKIPNSIYWSYELKLLLFVLVTLFGLIFEVGFKFLWFGLSFLYPILLNDELQAAFDNETGGVLDIMITGFSRVDVSEIMRTVVWQGLFIWLVVFVVLKAMLINRNLSFFGFSEWKFVQAFQRSKKSFVRSQDMLINLRHGLTYLPAAAVVGAVATSPVRMMVMTFLAYLGFHYLGCYVSRLGDFYLSKKGAAVLYVALVLAILIGGGLILVFEAHWIPYFFNGWAVLIYGCVLVFGSWLLLSYKHEEAYAISSLSQVQAAMVNMGSEMALGVSMRKKMSAESSERFNHLSGGAYLNAVLFHRYRKVLRKGLFWRLGLIVAIGLTLLALLFFIPFEPGDADPEANFSLINFLAALLFYLYTFSMSKKIVQMAFSNCDFAMLHYPSYRAKEEILSGFFYRFKRTLGYNLWIGAFVYGFTLLFEFLLQGFFDRQFAGITGFVFLSFTVLLSFHELFLYYVLQPFTADLKSKNPVYSMVNSGFYWLIWGLMMFDLGSIGFALIFGGVSTLYIIIGFLVVLKLAPKTFKIR